MGFEGKLLALPAEAAGPKGEYLEWHREHVFGRLELDQKTYGRIAYSNAGSCDGWYRREPMNLPRRRSLDKESDKANYTCIGLF